MFGAPWVNIPNGMPLSADITTRFMTAYLLSYLASLTTAFFRPHQMKGLIKLKAITMPFAMIGLFIWAMVRSGGPGTLELSNAPKSKALLGWSFVAAVNAAINGEFGPLIASDCKLSPLSILYDDVSDKSSRYLPLCSQAQGPTCWSAFSCTLERQCRRMFWNHRCCLHAKNLWRGVLEPWRGTLHS
jgi:hypothetical protein